MTDTHKMVKALMAAGFDEAAGGGNSHCQKR